MRANSLSCISIKNQECQTRPQVVNVKTIKWSGSCNNINHPYAKICVPNVAKNLNVK